MADAETVHCNAGTGVRSRAVIVWPMRSGAMAEKTMPSKVTKH